MNNIKSVPIDSESVLGLRWVGKESRFSEPVALRLESWKFKGVCDWLGLANRKVFGLGIWRFIYTFDLAMVIENGHNQTITRRAGEDCRE